ncbi:MAG: hypothetical protein IJV07_01275 [Alphaproteobacteria bacterium]|nr:hypothetical protein [Alphaproteobacteria bacterium]
MKNTNESGRSMVEMLGVLAIIGVLSIGGIAGYTLAMNRYRANEIMNAAAQVSIVAMSKDGGVGGEATLTDVGGVDSISLPGIDDDASITGYRNGVVSISINSEYEQVATILNSLLGSRKEGNCTTSGCVANFQKSVK